MNKNLIGLDFCGTLFARQSLRDLSYFALIGQPFNEAPAFLKRPRISKLIQALFLLCTTKAKRINSIRAYSFCYRDEINRSLINEYIVNKGDVEVFIASGSVLELIQEVCTINGISCPIIAASALDTVSARFHNFFKDPWTGSTKVRKIIERYPELAVNDKLHTFETDSSVDRPVASITTNYRQIDTSERFRSNN